MKLLFITHSYPPDIGGTAVMADRMVTALGDAGHRVTVLTTDNGASRSGTTTVSFSIVRRTPILYIIGLSARAWRSDRQENFDYIFLNDLPTTKAAALSFSRRMLRKTILVIHGSEPENVFLTPSLFTRATFFRHLYLRLLEQCCSIVAFSSFMKEKFLRHARATSIADKLRVCRMVSAFDVRAPEAHPDSLPAVAHPDRYLVLTVSRIVEKKGFERMLRIMASVISKDSRVHWHIVGSGPYELRLRQGIRDLSLEANITLLGAIKDRSTISRCYQSANVFLLLSDYEEGLGLVYLEAAAHGIPSIANDKSGEREAVKPHSSGFLTNSDQEVVDIILHRRAEPLRGRGAIYEFACQFDVKLLPECIFNFTKQLP